MISQTIFRVVSFITGIAERYTELSLPAKIAMMMAILLFLGIASQLGLFPHPSGRHHYASR
jgi:hypothetical protein